jgi:hypothetical protein
LIFFSSPSRTYFKKESAEFIQFPEKIVKPLEDILSGAVDRVVELRTSPCLFEAYDYAYNILEKEHVVLFQESDVVRALSNRFDDF